MSDKKKSVLCTTPASDTPIIRLPEVVNRRQMRKKTPTTDKEALFDWAEDFVRRHDEDFEELAKR